MKITVNPLRFSTARRFAILVLGLCISSQLQAQSNPATVCAACHGIDGNSVTSIWPKLAGQHAEYLSRQSRLIKSGERQVPEMIGIVAGLSEQQLDEIATYFSQQTMTPGVADESLLALGKRIYQTGISERGVAACQACHGPVGNGNPLAMVPRLAGQHADYSAKRLMWYRAQRSEEVSDDYVVQMVEVVANLQDEEIMAVASYLQGLHDMRQTGN